MEKNQVREDQIRNMKTVGPEYEYLVQIINLLYRQVTIPSLSFSFSHMIDAFLITRN